MKSGKVILRFRHNVFFKVSFFISKFFELDKFTLLPTVFFKKNKSGNICKLCNFLRYTFYLSESNEIWRQPLAKLVGVSLVTIKF